MIIDEIKTGCILKIYTNFISHSQDDISYLTYYLSDIDYENILKYKFSDEPRLHSAKTISQYFEYVAFRHVKSMKKIISRNLSYFILGKSCDAIFPVNKLDPFSAPLSSMQRDDIDRQFCDILRLYSLPKPKIKLVFPNYIPNLGRENIENLKYCFELYKFRNKSAAWDYWEYKNKYYVPNRESLFHEFITTLRSCEDFTDNGIVAFIYNQSTLGQDMRKILAELEQKENKLARSMFFVLKRQEIKNMELPSVCKFYEETFNQYKLDRYTLPFGYKEVHAHTQYDMGKESTNLRVTSKISRVTLKDKYEDALNKFLAENGTNTLKNNINTQFYRDSANSYGDIYQFICHILK